MSNKHLLEKALIYVEEHLKEPLILDEIASRANYSAWHFHRLFFAYTGITIGEYIRKRRMSEAAKELVYTSKPIKALASEYQFESQAAFTRAFKNFSGCTPGEVRKRLKPLLSFNAKLSTSKKGEPMQTPTIKHKNTFKVAGISCQNTMKDNNIPALWTEFNQKLCGKISSTINPGTALGICFFIEDAEMTDDTPFTYLAGMEVPVDSPDPQGLECRKVPEADYAVFEHHGSLDTLHDTYSSIYRDWLPESGYERLKADDFELYDQRFHYGEDDSVMEIWVPVKAKI